MASFSPLTPSGGVAPYTYSVTSGTLPAGLSLNTSTGAVTGTPSATYASANVVFSVQDANGVVANTSSSVSFSVTGELPDTGVTASQCYQAGSDTLVSCTSAAAIALNDKQDGMIGRDVSSPDNSDGKLGFSYSTVGSHAITECVQDNVTGLTWEGKPTSSTRIATYTNYGDNRAGDASAYVAAVNATGLCGYSDWRLPTADELQTLLDYSVAPPGPMIDGTWFPNTQPDYYWTATEYPANFSLAWHVYFGYGDIYPTYRNNARPVRLVRTSAVSADVQSRYTYSAAGDEVTDSQTGLVWRRCCEGQTWSAGTCTGTAASYTHEAALMQAKAQAGAAGWRLPNVRELSSITNKTGAAPAVDPMAFPATPSYFFWTSTPYAGNPRNAWYVYSYDGGSGHNLRSFASHVRLVR
jgi:hypothetical protein